MRSGAAHDEPAGVRRTLNRVGSGDGHLRVELLTSGDLRLSVTGPDGPPLVDTFGTLEQLMEAVAAHPDVPPALAEALVWELDLLALRGDGPST